MARHEAFILSDVQRETVQHYVPLLQQAQQSDLPVTVHYGYRDKSGTGTATGAVVSFHGSPNLSTASVLLDTERGPRTINTYLLSGLSY